MPDMETSDYRGWKGWDPEDFGRYTSVEAAGFRAELERAGFAGAPGATILEIGFGNGHFMAWAKGQGWTVIGIEIDSELVARARSFGLEAHVSEATVDSAIAGRALDLVVCFDVLEHLTVEEIVALLSGLRRALKPGGRILARFPSGDSPFGGSVQYSDLTHKTLIGSGMVQQFAGKAGLRVAQIREPAFPLRGVGPMRAARRLAVLLLRKIVSAAIKTAFHDGQPLVMTRNMVAVWAADEGKPQ